MKLSELSAASGCSTATIKYYLREGLLHPGVPLSGTTSDYDETHVKRLAIIRVLRDVGNLSVASIGEVLAAIDDEGLGVQDVLASAMYALGPHRDLPARDALEPTRTEVVEWLRAAGWEFSIDAPSIDLLTMALRGVREFWGDVGPEIFDRYLVIADEIGRGDLEHIDGVDDLQEAVRQIAVGTIVWEQALIALRRLADENHSRRRFR